MNTNDKGRGWQKFPGAPNRLGLRGPRITLNSRGVLLMNNHAWEALGRPSAVELQYNVDTETIGVLARAPGGYNAFPVRGKDNDRKYPYRVIHAIPFCKFFRITPRHTILFTNIRLDAEKKMLLDMTTAVPIGTRT